MNYIKQLESDKQATQRELDGLNKGIDSLIEYLLLPKFSCGDRLDGYVNISDVLLRLREARKFALHERENKS